MQNERLELSRTAWKAVMLPITSILLSCGLTSSHTPLALNHKLRSCGRVSKNHNDTITSRWFSRQGHIRSRTEFSGLQNQYITTYVLRPKFRESESNWQVLRHRLMRPVGITNILPEVCSLLYTTYHQYATSNLKKNPFFTETVCIKLAILGNKA